MVGLPTGHEELFYGGDREIYKSINSRLRDGERPRIREIFWLEMRYRDDVEMAIHVEKLRKERKWASTVRDALTLILNLREGRLDVLNRLFPFVQNEIEKRVQAAYETKLAALQATLAAKEAENERLWEQMKHQPAAVPQGFQVNVNARPLSSVAPDIDDIVIESSEAKSDANANVNFLNSLSAFMGTEFKVKIEPVAVEPPKPAEPTFNKMEVAPIANPVFEDEDDDLLL